MVRPARRTVKARHGYRRRGIMLSHDEIDRELRRLARAGFRPRLSVEAQLLRAGHIDQEEVPGTPSGAMPTPGRWQVRIPRLLAALRYLRRRAVGNSL
jgi:hypothetical protein